MSQFSESLSRFFQPLSMAQRVLFGVISVIIIGGIITVFMWSTRPDYSLLFGNLAPQSAQAIVEELSKKVCLTRLLTTEQALWFRVTKCTTYA